MPSTSAFYSINEASKPEVSASTITTARVRPDGTFQSMNVEMAPRGIGFAMIARG